MSRANPKTSPAQIARAERVATEIQLRLAGLTLEQIAVKMGVSTSTVETDIRKALQDAIRNAGMDLRAVQLQRYESLVQTLWPSAKQGSLGAIQRLLTVMEAQNKLMGVNAPDKIAPTTPDGEDPYEALTPEAERQVVNEEIAKILAEAAARQGQESR